MTCSPDAKTTIRPLAVPLATILLLVSIPASAAGAPKGGKAVGFLTGPQTGDAYDLAWAYVQAHRYVTRHNGVTHIHLQQRLGGIEVAGGVMNVNVAADGSIINLGNGFVGDLAIKANAASPELTGRAAIERAAEHFGLPGGRRDRRRHRRR